MKKARFMRAIAMLLALVLMLGAAVGVSAADGVDGTAKIISKNVDYSAELSLVFAVDPTNVDTAGGDEVYLLVWNSEVAAETALLGTENQKKSGVVSDTAINDVPNPLLFTTDRIPVDEMQKDFYVRTCIVRGAEEIYGELIIYSVEDYALQRLSESDVTADQAELYYNVLKYAIATDTVLNDGTQVDDKYVIFVADGMTFGEKGAKMATIWEGAKPFADDCVVKDAAGNVVNATGALTPGLYTVSPAPVAEETN